MTVASRGGSCGDEADVRERGGLLVKTALVNGVAGAVSMRDGEPFSVGAVTVPGGKIVALDILADPERLRLLDLTILDD